MKILYGILITLTAVIAWHVKLQYVFYDLFHRGDTTDWADVCKQPTYRQMGRVYTTDMDRWGVRLEPVGVDVDGLVAGGRKVFVTKGDAG